MLSSTGSSLPTAIAAAVVSLCALSVSIYEAYLMREQQAASVLPIVDFWAAYEPNKGYSLNLANKGLGPAFIRDIDVMVDGAKGKTWHEMLRKVAGQPIAHSESALIGSVMAVGEVGQPLAINLPEQATLVWENASRISLEVCYCSVFEQCWITLVEDLNVGTPTTSSVEVCPTKSDKSF